MNMFLRHRRKKTPGSTTSGAHLVTHWHRMARLDPMQIAVLAMYEPLHALAVHARIARPQLDVPQSTIC